jgi:8-oxo-dGTP pyrophosphatase MutT (NUDIX family)
MTYVGAGTILYYKDVETGVYNVLIGDESRYLEDSIPTMKLAHPDTGIIFDLQSFSDYQTVRANSIGEAMMQFDWRARSLSERANQQIRYDKPIQNSDSQIYSTHYRISSGKHGICKGRHEARDKSLYGTALRELCEETGIVLKKQNVTGVYVYERPHMKHTSYMIELTDDQREEIKTKINVRNTDYYGEMFSLRFLPLVGAYDKTMNVLTTLALRDFLRLMNKRVEKQ